jgi:hypothetical protein
VQRWRRDLEAFLSRFVAGHRGLRFGRLFGVPAAYAGRKLFSYAIDDGLVAKLPPAARELAIAKGARPWAPRNRQMAHWVIFRPGTASATDALVPFLEIAARHAALDTGRSRS